MTTKIANFKEEFSAKIPALALLSNLGCTFIPPSECEALRGNTLANEKEIAHQVILLHVMQKLIDHSINIYDTIHNITATLSALFPLIKGVSRNLGGFSLPAIYLPQINKVGK